jgi:YggT family protein
MGYSLSQLIYYASQIIIYIVIAHVLLSYFVQPDHPIRVAIDRLVLPLLNPIRRIVPLIGMIDISPMILIILVQLIAWVLTFLLTMIFPR